MSDNLNETNNEINETNETETAENKTDTVKEQQTEAVTASAQESVKAGEDKNN